MFVHVVQWARMMAQVKHDRILIVGLLYARPEKTRSASFRILEELYSKKL